MCQPQADIGGVATLIQTGNLVFSNCRFSSNRATKFGGVMNAVGSSAAEVTDLSVYNSMFNDNRCDEGRGGAISLGLSASSELRVRCVCVHARVPPCRSPGVCQRVGDHAIPYPAPLSCRAELHHREQLREADWRRLVPGLCVARHSAGRHHGRR